MLVLFYSRLTRLKEGEQQHETSSLNNAIWVEFEHCAPSSDNNWFACLSSTVHGKWLVLLISYCQIVVATNNRKDHVVRCYSALVVYMYYIYCSWTKCQFFFSIFFKYLTAFKFAKAAVIEGESFNVTQWSKYFVSK